MFEFQLVVRDRSFSYTVYTTWSVDKSDMSWLKTEKWRAIRGMALLALVFCLHFTAYNGLGSLQSSLNREEGMGVTTQALVYACFVISSFYIPRQVLHSNKILLFCRKLK